MPLTVVTCSVVLNRRWGECAALADMQDALSWSASMLALNVANVGAIVDNDLVPVTNALYPQLMDVAECRGLATIVDNLDAVNLIGIGVKGDPDKLRLKYQGMLDRKMAFIKSAYGIGLPTLSVGVINMNFQEQFDPGVSPMEF